MIYYVLYSIMLYIDIPYTMYCTLFCPQYINILAGLDLKAQAPLSFAGDSQLFSIRGFRAYPRGVYPELVGMIRGH